MTGRIPLLILLGIIVGVILGGILGAVTPDAMLAASMVGKLYFNALAIVAVVLVLIGLPLAVARFGDVRSFDSSTASSFVITLVTAVLTIGIGALIVRVMTAQALSGVGLTASMNDTFGDFRVTGNFLGTLLPESLMRSVRQGSYLGWVMFALVVGLVLPTITVRSRTLVMLFEEANDVVLRMAELLLFLAPLGLLFLTGTIVALNRVSTGALFANYGWYPLAVVIIGVLFGALLLPMIVRWWGRQPEVAKQRVGIPKGRPEPAFAGGRPPRGGHGRFERSREGRPDRDRDRGPRDRGDRGRDAFRRERPNRPDRPDRADRPERQDRPDRPDRRERDESPFAVTPSVHAFDPEASQIAPIPTPAVNPPEVSPEVGERTGGDERRGPRPEGSGHREYDRGRGDRGGRRDRDRRDRGGRGGRDRGGRDRGRRERPAFPSEEQEPAAGPSITLRETGEYNGSADLSAGSEQAAGGAPDRLPERMASESERLVGSDRVAGEARYRDSERGEHTYGAERVDRQDEFRTPLAEETRKEPIETSEADMSYGRSHRVNRPDRTHDEGEAGGSSAPEPAGGADVPKPIDSFSTEGMEFGGRNKRKRPR